MNRKVLHQQEVFLEKFFSNPIHLPTSMPNLNVEYPIIALGIQPGGYGPRIKFEIEFNNIDLKYNIGLIQSKFKLKINLILCRIFSKIFALHSAAQTQLGANEYRNEFDVLAYNQKWGMNPMGTQECGKSN